MLPDTTHTEFLRLPPWPYSVFKDRSSKSHQIPTDPAGIQKTAITTPSGVFELVRMPFGLHNAAQTFQRIIDQVLRGLGFCYAYIDDLLVASSLAEEHGHQVFKHVRHYGMTINPQKCAFVVLKVEFLGHSVNSTGIHPLPAKVQTILDFPKPPSHCQLFTFVGLINFYQQFIPECAKIVDPLNTLLTKSVKEQLSWEDSQTLSFTAIKGYFAGPSQTQRANQHHDRCLRLCY